MQLDSQDIKLRSSSKELKIFELIWNERLLLMKANNTGINKIDRKEIKNSQWKFLKRAEKY